MPSNLRAGPGRVHGGMPRAQRGIVLSHWRAIVFVCACGWFTLFDQTASAALVNWDTLTWAPGSLSNSLDVDPTTAGNDVTVTIDVVKANFTTNRGGGLLTPAITNSLQGGVSPLEKSLELAANLGTTSKITMTVTFSPLYTLGVNNVTFSIFDIDLETNKDQISNIYGVALNGTHIAPTVTFGSAVTQTGAGLGLKLTGTGASPDAGLGSGAGTATISFGSTPITGFTFTWTNSNGAPFYQQIAMGDISYNVVPEVDTAAVAFAICVLAVSTRRLRCFLPRRAGARR